MRQAIAVILILGSLPALLLGSIGLLFARVPFLKLRGRRAWGGVALGAIVAFFAGGSLVSPQASSPIPPPISGINPASIPGTQRPKPRRRLALQIAQIPAFAITQILDANGTEVARMQGADTHFSLRPGVYFARASAGGYVPAKARLELRGPRHLSFTLKRDLIAISLTANASSATFRVYEAGGRLAASASGASARFSLPRARYKIAVRASGYEPTAIWSQGGSTRVTLKRIPPPPPPPSVVALETPASGSSGNGYINSAGEFVPSPAFSDRRPADASAQCRDGSYSFSRSRRGTCSHHGGVAEWY